MSMHPKAILASVCLASLSLAACSEPGHMAVNSKLCADFKSATAAPGDAAFLAACFALQGPLCRGQSLSWHSCARAQGHEGDSAAAKSEKKSALRHEGRGRR